MTDNSIINDNSYQAHHKSGIPPTTRQIPFRNIRDVLSLHTKSSSKRTCLIYFNENGNREEYSFAEFNARVHQVANFMYEDLEINRGDRVATLLDNTVDTALIYFACWVIGASVVPIDADKSDSEIKHIFQDSNAKICFTQAHYLERTDKIANSDETAPILDLIIEVGGTPCDDYINFHDAVKNRPTTFLGDESGAKSADMPISDGTDATARLDDEALLIYPSDASDGIMLTQYNLLVNAMSSSQWQAITGNQRMMGVLPLHQVSDIVSTLLTPLYAGGLIVLNHSFDPTQFWDHVVQEHVNLVAVTPTILQSLLDYGMAQVADGNTIFGSNINRRNLTHFRHFMCNTGTLSIDLAQKFEDTFGFTILNGDGRNETAGYICSLPIDLSWHSHQSWMFDHGYPSVGCAMASNDVAIFSSDGEQLGEGERGEICVRGHNVMTGSSDNTDMFKDGWFHTGDEGFYLTDNHGRQFFFITGQVG